MSLLYNTEAVLLASHSHRVGQDTVQAFYHLASSLKNRLRLFGQPSEAQYCIEYFHYLKSLPLDTFGVSSDAVKIKLLSALASQVELCIGDGAQNIQEMAVCCRHFLASNIPQPMLKLAITDLTRSIQVYQGQPLVWECMDQVIECLREANSHHYSPEFAKHLAVLLSICFQGFGSIDGYEEAMALLDKIITNRDSPAHWVTHARFHSCSLSCERARMYEAPARLEEAIYRHGEFLRTLPTDDDDCYRSEITRNLAVLMAIHTNILGVTEEGLPEALSPDAEVTSFPHLIASLRARSTTDKTIWAVPEEGTKHLRVLESVCRATNIVEIGDAIEYCRLLLASTPPRHHVILRTVKTLGKVLFHAFKSTDNIEYLNESIATFHDILQLPIARFDLFNVIDELLVPLSAHLTLSGDKRDFDEILQLYSRASKDTYANARDRLRMSYQWADNARLNGHHSTSAAYETALSSLQDTLLFAPTLETQHFHLMTMRDIVEKLPLDIASYHVGRGQLKDAIQALEQGRALIWSEMRGLHTSIDQIPVDSRLAREFTVVNKELETLMTSVSSHMWRNDNDGTEDGEGMGEFGRLAVRRHELLAKRKDLVSQMQAPPGLEGFMKTPSFNTLRSAAVHGPVIIVNHSEWRCDILIVLRHMHPSLITTPEYFYGHAIELRNRLVHT